MARTEPCEVCGLPTPGVAPDGRVAHVGCVIDVSMLRRHDPTRTRHDALAHELSKLTGLDIVGALRVRTRRRHVWALVLRSGRRIHIGPTWAVRDPEWLDRVLAAAGASADRKINSANASRVATLVHRVADTSAERGR